MDKNDISTRERIFNIIYRQPGIRLCELTRECGLSRNSVTYHTHRLVQDSDVEEKRDGKYLRFYDKNKGKNQRLFELNCIKQKLICDTLISNCSLAQNEIIKETSMSQQLVSYHLKKLIEKEIVESVNNLGRTEYRLSNSYKPLGDKRFI